MTAISSTTFCDDVASIQQVFTEYRFTNRTQVKDRDIMKFILERTVCVPTSGFLRLTNCIDLNQIGRRFGP